MSKKDKRMDAFAREAFRLGALHGFKHFELELRGREELLVTVHAGSGPRDYSAPGLEPVHRLEADSLPPASPCLRESHSQRWGHEQDAVFLIGAYAHYAVPLVWVRAGHSLLGTFHGHDSFDAPVALFSTQAWNDRTVRVFEVVAELIASIACPPPKNPFELKQGAAQPPPRHARSAWSELSCALSSARLSIKKISPPDTTNPTSSQTTKRHNKHTHSTTSDACLRVGEAARGHDALAQVAH